MRPDIEPLERELSAANLSEDERAKSEATDAARRNVCPSCAQPHFRANISVKAAPFALLMAVARLAIALGAAILFIAIVVSLLQWRALRPGEIWALFASFALAIGVLLLYEIRDLLVERSATSFEKSQTAVPRIIAPGQKMAGEVVRTIGALGSLVWLPLQAAEDRTLLGHLSAAEQRELQNRLGILTLCMAGTTIVPVFVAFIFMSPEAVCLATTAIALNLFVHDWFKKRHKKWLYSSEFARRQGIKPAGE